MNQKTIFPFNFHGDKLYIVEHKGEPYVAMKHVVEGMGLNWKAQYTRLKQRFDTCVVEMTMQIPGDDQRRLVICLGLRKLPGWLMTINANKVKPEIRAKVIQYQQECDDALYDYWTKGIAINTRLTGKDRMRYFEQYHTLLNQICRHREYGIRKALYADAKALADALNRDIPDLEDIVGKEPEIGDPCLDSNEVFEFWDLFDMLENTASPKLNHSNDPDVIAIDPFAFRQYCKGKEFEFPSLDIVRREMRTRSRYPFLGYQVMKSAITGESVQCWIFRQR
ncbi:phage antirepressor N-terminal domain-containing protein [Serratia marcescens]